MVKKLIIATVLLLFGAAVKSTNDSIFKQLAFGRDMSVVYIGGGPFNRHFDLGVIQSGLKNYYKSPAFVIGADYCFYPYASNAYLGIGPFFSGCLSVKNSKTGTNTIQSISYNVLVAAKLTHHPAYYVRKNFDLSSGYILGFYFDEYQMYKVNGSDAKSPPRTWIRPAFGISLCLRYYFYKSVGVYGEGGLGYKTNFLTMGICYKIREAY